MQDVYARAQKRCDLHQRASSTLLRAAEGPCVVKAMPGAWPSCAAMEEENNTRNKREMLGGSICHSM